MLATTCVRRAAVVLGLALLAGLPACGGPDDAAIADLKIGSNSSSWIRDVLNYGNAVVAGPVEDGDYQLARALGEELPGQIFLGPIQSEGETVALLYADQLPENGEIGDTGDLERALEQAGRALERAVRERTGDPA